MIPHRKFFHRFFSIVHRNSDVRVQTFLYIPFIVSLLLVVAAIFDVGFDQTAFMRRILHLVYLVGFIVEVLALLLRLIRPVQRRVAVVFVDVLMCLVLLGYIPVLFGHVWLPALSNPYWQGLLILLIFVREASIVHLKIRRSLLNPAQMFLFSFLLLIVMGAMLLCMPHATFEGISLLDALFTSTSAVCVTGLAVVDTGATFTTFGLIVLMLLMQLGGLGMMTFTSYFSYFFKGGTSYENQLALQEMTNADKISEVFLVLRRILLLTLGIELLGGLLIYHFLQTSGLFPEQGRLLFTFFHSISAFCNAGFSTLSNSLYEVGYRMNYGLQLVVASLFIVGGLGFPILFNLVRYLKHLLTHKLLNKRGVSMPWVINLHTRVVLITSVSLLVLGTLGVFLLEWEGVLAEHSGVGKWVVAFFTAATPRTAGFNVVDTAAIQLPTLLLVVFLMWVGASPGSTGGGIKTSTFAIALLNSISIAKGKDRIDCFGREVSPITVRRAYSQVFLSVLVIVAATWALSLFEPEQRFRALFFETVSAFSTVGLSTGLTPFLSIGGKWVLIVTMFVGRLSMLTFMVAFFKQVTYLKYRYPQEDILIN
ncbi:MAG: TrkH family potassium uptake protein [Bacteroidales bacterium]